ncbi:hypothetical protein D3C86_1621270 [compost metagenome]
MPALTLSPMYFDSLLAVKGALPQANFSKELLEFLDRQPVQTRDSAPEPRVEFLAWILANSFPGVISDPESDPSCMDVGNLNRVAEGFQTLMKTMAKREAPTVTAS